MRVRRLARREVVDALRSYWFVLDAALFTAGGLALVLFGGGDAEVLGYRGYARALAGLAQLAMFFVPLMALFPATAALAGDREAGTLEYVLAQPVTRGEVFLGKWVGVATAVLLSLVAGFGVIGTVAVARGVPGALVAGLLGFTLLLGAAFTSLGLWLSAGASTRSRATSLGLTVWIFLLALGSLGVMGALVRWGLPASALEAWTLANPVEAFRVAMVAVLDPEASVLGPVGASLIGTLGRGGLVAAAAGSLVLWSAAAAGLGLRRLATYTEPRS
jgi:Cu-processing system permease protein